VPGYSLPSAGAALALGQQNTFQDIRPGALNATEWNAIVWQAYGTGTWVDDWSAGGAYIAGAAGGGHTDGRNYSGATLDLTDRTWKRLDPTNANATPSATNHTTAQTSGSPYYEVNSSGGTPAAAHLYAHQIALPSALGGGSRGSLLQVGRAAACVESVNTMSVHVAALGASDLTWSRYTNNTGTRITFDGFNVLDAARNRVWIVPDNAESYTSGYYFDLADSTFKTAGSVGFPDGNVGGAAGAHVGDRALHVAGVLRRDRLPTVAAWINQRADTDPAGVTHGD
jgi:hypothetical protein